MATLKSEYAKIQKKIYIHREENILYGGLYQFGNNVHDVHKLDFKLNVFKRMGILFEQQLKNITLFKQKGYLILDKAPVEAIYVSHSHHILAHIY